MMFGHKDVKWYHIDGYFTAIEPEVRVPILFHNQLGLDTTSYAVKLMA